MGPDNELKIGISSVPEEGENLPLAGKVFLLTGASRGIGAATAIELARRGATIIGPHRQATEKAIARAQSVVQKVEQLGGRMIALVADLTSQSDISSLVNLVKRDFGQIDGIIFNHAGGLEEDKKADPDYPKKVNAQSKLDLFQEADLAGILKHDAILIDIPSNWSRFFHAGIEQLPEYDPLAESKKQGEQMLRNAVNDYNGYYQDQGRRIKLGMVCGHAIDRTSTVILLRRKYREYFNALKATTETGAFPLINDMAVAIADMAKGDFYNGDTVFVGSKQIRPNNMPQALPMYNRDTRHVDSMVFPDGKKVFGFLRIRDEHTQDYFTPDLGASEDMGNGSMALEVTTEHTEGHFTPEYNLLVLPGIKLVVAAMRSAENLLRHLRGYDGQFRLNGISGPISFERPIFPGDILTFRPKVRGGFVDVDAMWRDRRAGRVQGIRLARDEGEFVSHISEGGLLEGAAQAAGLDYLIKEAIRGGAPLFSGVRRLEQYRRVLPGELVEYDVVTRDLPGKREGFLADVIARVDDKPVSSYKNLACLIFRDVRLARRVISILRAMK